MARLLTSLKKMAATIALLPIVLSSQGQATPAFPVAFPGAEGFGKFATGGRGGRVFIVTNLDDSGSGSFREAAESPEKRFIVFAVSGTIHLSSRLAIRGQCSIAGQSAPGDGICLADQPVMLAGDNIIIRYLRFRMGDRFQRGGMVDGNGGDDAFGGTRKKFILIDHCSMSWSTDEVCSIYAGDSSTIQWNIISEPLNYSYHFEAGDTGYEHHGYGGIWGGQHLSAHHNLFAHCTSRNPRFNGTRHTASELVDFCNNVIYNWGINTVYAGEGGNYNLINNYYKPGPDTRKNVLTRIANPGRNGQIGFGRWYIAGNEVEGAELVSRDNRKGIVMGNEASDEDRRLAIIGSPHPAEPLFLQSARESYESVLRTAGASFRRDTLDERIAKNVRERSGRIIDVQGGFPHGTAYEQTLSAWPALRSVAAPADSDRDGIPDAWETANGLNKNDPADGCQLTLHPFYTNLEMYLNDLLDQEK